LLLAGNNFVFSVWVGSNELRKHSGVHSTSKETPKTITSPHHHITTSPHDHTRN